MNDVPEDEARATLAVPRVCEDPSDWVAIAKPAGTWMVEQGLVDENGERSGLFVSLVFYRSPTTRLMTLKFSVMKQGRKGASTERVYQMQVIAASYHPKSDHDRVHEHVGTGRYVIAGWETWRGFNDALAYFTTRTNITFRPQIEDPEDFRLKP